MLLKVWRTSHMLLALIGSAFFIAATLSGVILSVEPISQHSSHFIKWGANRAPLPNFIHQIKEEYETVLEVEVLKSKAIKISTIDEDPEKDGDFFVDPFTGKKLGDLPPKNQFFQATYHHY